MECETNLTIDGRQDQLYPGRTSTPALPLTNCKSNFDLDESPSTNPMTNPTLHGPADQLCHERTIRPSLTTRHHKTNSSIRALTTTLLPPRSSLNSRCSREVVLWPGRSREAGEEGSGRGRAGWKRWTNIELTPSSRMPLGGCKRKERRASNAFITG